MSCPYASVSLATTPGKKSDDSARRLRQEYLDGKIDPEQFIRENAYTFPNTKDRRFKNQVQSYGLASIVIESFWAHMMQNSLRFNAAIDGLKHKSAGQSYDDSVEGFFSYSSALVGVLQKQYLEGIKRKKSVGAFSDAEKAFLCFASVARKRHMKSGKLPFPSMKDLLAFVARIAQVIPRVYERDFGRVPSVPEILAILRQPSVMIFFTQLMMLDRHSTYPFFALLEGHARPNTNNGKRRFSPDYFELYAHEGSISLRLRQEVVEQYHAHHVRAAKRRAKRGKPEPMMLGCPALYTGLFREMFVWTCDLLERWL